MPVRSDSRRLRSSRGNAARRARSPISRRLQHAARYSGAMPDCRKNREAFRWAGRGCRGVRMTTARERPCSAQRKSHLSCRHPSRAGRSPPSPGALQHGNAALDRGERHGRSRRDSPPGRPGAQGRRKASGALTHRRRGAVRTLHGQGSALPGRGRPPAAPGPGAQAGPDHLRPGAGRPREHLWAGADEREAASRAHPRAEPISNGRQFPAAAKRGPPDRVRHAGGRDGSS